MSKNNLVLCRVSDYRNEPNYSFQFLYKISDELRSLLEEEVKQYMSKFPKGVQLNDTHFAQESLYKIDIKDIEINASWNEPVNQS